VIRLITTLSVVVLAGIAAVLSYRHMYVLVRRYGETSWTAALLPVSVDGMIAVASMTLLADSRNGRRSGLLPWALLVIGSTASLAANVAVAEPSLVGRLIAAWPSCALIGSYELLMRQVRHASPTIATSRTVSAAPSMVYRVSAESPRTADVGDHVIHEGRGCRSRVSERRASKCANGDRPNCSWTPVVTPAGRTGGGERPVRAAGRGGPATRRR
jgi:hypothetical protein